MIVTPLHHEIALTTLSHSFSTALLAGIVFALASLGHTPAFSQDAVTLPAKDLDPRTGTTSDARSPGDALPLDQSAAFAAALADLPPDVLASGNEAKEDFLRLKRELVESLTQMRGTYLYYHNEEDQSPAAIDRYRQQRNATRDLMNQLFEAGLVVIRFIPDEEILQYILTVLEHRMNCGFYDVHSVEAGARLIDGNFQHSFLFPSTLRGAVVTGDFKLARSLAKVLDVEKLQELDQKLIYLIDDFEEQFEQDKKAQEKDAELDNNPRVKMVTTKGEVTIELYINQAPSTVANFIQLVEQGYYDGLDFFQVIEDLLALTGDMSGDGNGNTGKFLMDEHERPDARPALAGSLVMAKRPLSEGKFVPHSASAQFAILLLPVVSATESQTVFGRVIEGMDSICELRRVDPTKKKEKNAIVFPPDRVLSMEMIRKPKKLPEIQYSDTYNATGAASPIGPPNASVPTK